MMYIAVRKVVMPATISVFVREPAARMPKNRSRAVVSRCDVAVVSIFIAFSTVSAWLYCFQYASRRATIAARSPSVTNEASRLFFNSV